MEEELDTAIAEENYDLAAQLGMDTDTLRSEIDSEAPPVDDGAVLSALWAEKVRWMHSTVQPAVLNVDVKFLVPFPCYYRFIVSFLTHAVYYLPYD